MTNPPLTRLIAEYVVSPNVPNLMNGEACALSTRSLVDTVGVALAGRRDPSVQILADTLGPSTGETPATSLIDGTKTDAMTAALLNATAAHALDFDDVSETVFGHPSAVLWPALLAVGETVGASGRRLLEAFAVGYQVQCCIAAGLQVRKHYAQGWHASATTGVLAAAAALCYLTRLDVLKARRALGLAASMASGSRQNFGTMSKPLHLGLAARNAVLATSLATRGFTSDPDQLDSRLGYFAQFSDRPDFPAALTFLNAPLALVAQGLTTKRHPCCYCTHRAADAALELSTKVRPSEIVNVVVTLEPGGLDALIHHNPVDGRQGQFSAEYVVASALLDGRLGLETFSTEAVRRPDAQRLLRRVMVRESREPPLGESHWADGFATVEVETAREVFKCRVDVPRGSPQNPLTESELHEKFRNCLEHAQVKFQPACLYDELVSVVRHPTLGPIFGVLQADHG